MSEADELKEAAERAKESKELAPVSLTMAILAVMVATCTLLGHRAHTEEILLQTRATDQWSYYQSKSIKETSLTSKTEVLEALGKPIPGSDQEKIAQYQREKEQIEKKAEELEKQAQIHLRTHEVLASSVTMFQIAIAVGAISVLIRSRVFWLASLAVGLVGIVFFIQSFFQAGIG